MRSPLPWSRRGGRARAVCALALALTACAPDTTPPPKWWTVRDYLPAAAAKKRFGGLDPARLAVGDGPVPFRGPPWEPQATRNQGGTGLAVLPAFAAAEPAAVVITDVWQDHPTPWVQPVYVLVTEWDATNPGSKRLPGTWSLFPVSLDSAFYSPYWRLTYLEVPADTPADSLTSAGAALRAARSVHEGALVLCTIVPLDTALATGAGEAPVRPFTLEPVSPRAIRHAWVDGVDVPYVDFGRDLFSASPSALVDEAPLYAFVKVDAAGTVSRLDLPFVLDDQPFAQALLRRHDVAVAPGMAVFVPADRPELRDSLRAAGLEVPDASPLIPEAVARAYTLRVATSSGCFGAPSGFPGDCRWLDSRAAIEALPRHTVTRSTVQLTVATLRAGTRVLP